MADSLRDRLQTALGSTYTLDRELGGGGMSRVFVGVEHALGRQVVVKILPPDLAAEVSIERFKREISLAARLQHPHIVPLLTSGVIEGMPYFTMPFVEGESLRVRLAERGELPIAEAMRILREVASALAYAHERGVVHRDIKPANVLLSGGAAMVTDFGIAKAISASTKAEQSGVTSLGVALGTPAYMSPEQASADPTVDHRADVYAVGVLAYELLTGQPPFVGRTPQGLLAAHVTEAPEAIQRRRPGLPQALAALVMRCLEKRAADRPQSAAEIVHALDDITTPSGGMTPTGAVKATHARSPLRRRTAAAVLALALALATLGVFAFVQYRSLRQTAGAAAAMPQSIAVLPLVNAGGDTATQYFADGMTDELTTALTKVPGLRIVSRSAAAAAKDLDLKTVGQRLGVGAVLEGRIRRAENRMRLSAQLTKVADGVVLWSESYEADAKDAFKVQDDVARAIAVALRVTLTGGAPPPVTQQATASPKAHDLYLRGRYLQAKYNEVDLRQSIALFEAATREDPKYVLAWAGLADSWGMLGDDYISPRQAMPKMRDAIAKGLAIDSTVPALRIARANIAFFSDRDLETARRLLERALVERPDFAYAPVIFAWTLRLDGMVDSADAVVRRWVASDPASPTTLGTAGYYYYHTRQDSRAREACAAARELDPQQCRRLFFELDGKLEEAATWARERMSSPDRRIAVGVGMVSLAILQARLGRTVEARRILNDLEAEYRRHYVREDAIAMVHAALGDGDKAIEWLERAERSGSWGIGELYRVWGREPFRTDPRFLSFAKRVGLPDPPPGWSQ